jgi:hypothetical protein
MTKTESLIPLEPKRNRSIEGGADERHDTMTTYTVYLASKSIRYGETQIEAETPQQALELAKKMAKEKGSNLLDLLGRQYHDDPDIQVIRIHDESTRFCRAAWRRPLPHGVSSHDAWPYSTWWKNCRDEARFCREADRQQAGTVSLLPLDCDGGEDESQAQMNTMTSSAPSEFAPSLLVKPSAEAPAVRPANLKNDQVPAKRSWLGVLGPLAFARYMITLVLGIAVTLAWQSYGDAVRHKTASAALFLDEQQLSAILLDLNTMRQSINGLATSIATNQEQIIGSVDQLTASREQMSREIANVQPVEQYILYKNSDPPPLAVPAATPRPVQRPSQAPTAPTPAKNP